ncbi:hypothetical protein GDO78_022781 [Eleutherodactylus coqui]|uniref:Uncharacterized protein n=1 Tax=Eleutherodactylus coqui TaxID=57060 RepID=A0A8J6E4T2_ELECQ|nr:hypothetical protein GDO78_022781 [Eleutherodactylus coqui]
MPPYRWTYGCHRGLVIKQKLLTHYSEVHVAFGTSLGRHWHLTPPPSSHCTLLPNCWAFLQIRASPRCGRSSILFDR